jgi:hypothetical protein
LGEALLAKGQFAEARLATLDCLKLLPNKHPLRQTAEEQLQQCDNLLVLDRKLAAFLGGGELPPEIPEQLALAELCGRYKQYHALATELYAGALAARPDLADDLKKGYRYSAACSAALAAAGKGLDPQQSGPEKRIRFRARALAWLRTELDLWTKQLGSDKPEARTQGQQALKHWQQDADLAGLRDEAALAKLPQAEQQACRQLWAEVQKRLDQARGKP